MESGLWTNPFEHIQAFEWDERKRETNLRLHQIDFEDVTGIFDAPFISRRSDRNNEVRYQVFGYVHGREVAVACTLRDEGRLCRLISARRARRDERRKYYARLAGRSPAWED